MPQFSTSDAFLLGVLVFSITLALLALLVKNAPRLGLLDRPGGHKKHRHPTPVVGGLAVFAGSASILCLGGFSLPVVALYGIGAVLVAMGAWDDVRTLRASQRFAVQLGVAALMVGVSGWSVENLGDLLGFGPLQLGPFAELFTVFAVVALVNAINMIDGSDGLAGSCVLVGLIAIGLWAGAVGAPMPQRLALGLAGAVAAFLVFNLPSRERRRNFCFLGDAGSNFLGYAIALLALMTLQQGHATSGTLQPALVLWFLPVPIFELFYTVARRRLQGVPASAADRGHWHHRFRDAGFAKHLVVWLYAGYSVACAIVGLTLNAFFPPAALTVGFVLAFLVWCALLNRVLALREGAPQRVSV